MCANLLKYLLKPAAGGKRTIKVPVGSQAGWGTPGLGSTPLQLLQGQPAPPPPRLAPHQFVVTLCVAPCEGGGLGPLQSPSVPSRCYQKCVPNVPSFCVSTSVFWSSRQPGSTRERIINLISC